MIVVSAVILLGVLSLATVVQVGIDFLRRSSALHRNGV